MSPWDDHTDPWDEDPWPGGPSADISGWRITAPAGTPQEAVDFLVEELADRGIPSVTDAMDAVAPPHPRTVDNGPMLMSVEKLEAHMDHFLRGASIGELLGHRIQEQAMFRAMHPTQITERSWFTTNPGGDSPMKRRFVDTTTPTEYTWTVDITRDDMAASLFRRQPFDDLTEETHTLIAGWATEPQPRPGWRGSLTGPPRPLPADHGHTWHPAHGVIGPDGRKHKLGGPSKQRTIIVEPGADSNPDARLMEFQGGRLVDIGPAYPHGLAPAYRGKPAPIPWDSPLADPVGDMRRAVEDDRW